MLPMPGSAHPPTMPAMASARATLNVFIARLLGYAEVTRCLILKRLAEILPQAFVDRLARRAVVLAAAMGDLERSHHGGKSRRFEPAPAARHAVEKPRPIGVAATRGIDERFGFHGRHRVAVSVDPEGRPFCAKRDREAVDQLGNLLRALSGLLLDDARLVVAHREACRPGDQLEQF